MILLFRQPLQLLSVLQLALLYVPVLVLVLLLLLLLLPELQHYLLLPMLLL